MVTGQRLLPGASTLWNKTMFQAIASIEKPIAAIMQKTTNPLSESFIYLLFWILLLKCLIMPLAGFQKIIEFSVIVAIIYNRISCYLFELFDSS